MITITSLRITAIYFNRIAFHLLLYSGVVTLIVMLLGSGLGGLESLFQVTTFFLEGKDLQVNLFDFFVNTVFCEDTENLPKVIEINNLHLTDTLKTAKDTIKGQSGVYAFQCLETGTYYIGSSVDLYNRFYDHLMNDSSNLHLQRAIVLYGLPSFLFFVIEFCAKDQLLSREQHWLDWLFTQPAELRYNFLPTAGSSLGSTHTEEAKMKMRGPRPHFSPSAEQRESISQANTGKVMSKVTRASISKALSRSVYLYDTKDQLVRVFSSNREAANWLNVSKATVSKYVRSRKVLNGLYTLRAS